MYTPPKFKIENQEMILDFINENSFGLLLSIEGTSIHDTHTPFILSKCKRYLLGHIAKANPQWNSWGKDSVAKVIFTGSHAYISPKYYESEFAVPTWNYTAVSVSGKLNIIDDIAKKIDFLDNLTSTHETSEDPWFFDHEDERYLNLLSGIVVFSVEIDKLEASFKLNQNRSIEDQSKVIQSLSSNSCPIAHDVAALMKENIDAEHNKTKL